ncbi:transcription factor bHLH36-like [Vicia villosa]|uniref:transcription factor bHLH36-like n=1 Tax=Vicia villosa TaxID=3911 RepID=UPI00273C8C59|nr:transcription factor bHLH36-like [Vicia villosa]
MAEDQKQHKISSTLVNDEKKIIRKEVEKQRRMQMSILCSSLSSSLPFHLIKGKRSVSDQIGEAANYVQFLKEKVNELEVKRDKLKEIISSRMIETANIELSADPSNMVKCVNINQIPDGVEIVICLGFEDCGSRLSDLMKIIVQEGCDVVHCVTNHVNGKIFHTIKSEVEDLTHFDLARLQNKLDHAILLSR